MNTPAIFDTSEKQPSGYALADSILENAEPQIAQNLVQLTLGSDNPADSIKYLELMVKRRQKESVGSGALVNLIIDTSSGTFSAKTEVIEDAVVAQPTPAQEFTPISTDEVIDLSDLLDLNA